MSAGPVLTVVSHGLQTTIQAEPRRGLRHLGVPGAGPADPLSLALANRIVGNLPDAAGIEITLTAAAFEARTAVDVAVAGAPCQVTVSDVPTRHHAPIRLSEGQTIRLEPATVGCRTYLAARGGLLADEVLGARSTYLPAQLGGHKGRALKEGDLLHALPSSEAPMAETPLALRPPFGDSWTLRATTGPEADVLDDAGLDQLFGAGWRASPASDRVGVRLDGQPIRSSDRSGMDSVPVLPGTVQLPAGGRPILLGVDAGTTGGYPRIAQVIRADRHLIGQIRPGAPVRLLRWEAEHADAVLAEKTRLLSNWLGATFRL